MRAGRGELDSIVMASNSHCTDVISKIGVNIKALEINVAYNDSTINCTVLKHRFRIYLFTVSIFRTELWPTMHVTWTQLPGNPHQRGMDYIEVVTVIHPGCKYVENKVRRFDPYTCSFGS